MSSSVLETGRLYLIFADDQRFRLNMTRQEKDLNIRGPGLIHGPAKLRVHCDIGSDFFDAVHLDHERKDSPVALPRGSDHLVNMIDAPFRLCVREIADAIHLQRASFSSAYFKTLTSSLSKASISSRN